jgi:hypothetical protein
MRYLQNGSSNAVIKKEQKSKKFWKKSKQIMTSDPCKILVPNTSKHKIFAKYSQQSHSKVTH